MIHFVQRLKNIPSLSLVKRVVKVTGLVNVVVYLGRVFINTVDRYTNNQDLILFGSERGFEGNSRYVYEWILNNNEGVKVYWITHDRYVKSDLEKEGLPVAHSESLYGIYLLFRAKVAIVNQGLRDIAIDSEIVPNSIAYIDTRTTCLPRHRERKEPKFDKAERDVVRLCSSEVQKRYALMHRCNNRNTDSVPNYIKDEYKITGIPKSDLIIKPSEDLKKEWEDFHSNGSAKTILYAPSRVTDTKTHKEFFPFPEFKPRKINNVLVDNNTILYIRPHPKDIMDMKNYKGKNIRRKLETIFEKCSNIKPAYHTNVSLLGILPFVDCLVTDNSTTYIEYLLTDNPVIFIDQSCYPPSENTKFIIDFDNIKSGPTSSNFDGFLHHIINSLKDPGQYKESRNVIRDRFYEYGDGNSRKRVTNLAIDYLDGN